MAGPDQASTQSSEVLGQTRKMPGGPIRMVAGGLLAVATIGYFVLFSNKKAEVTALDVAKVTTGVSTPDNTHPRN